MKKFFGILIGITTLTSCCCPDTSTNQSTTVITDTGHEYNIRNISYKGHKYIMFHGHEKMAVVHDPDCYCASNF